MFSIPDWGENEKYRDRVEKEDTFKWVTASCYARSYYPDGFDFRLTPLCQKVRGLTGSDHNIEYISILRYIS